MTAGLQALSDCMSTHLVDCRIYAAVLDGTSATVIRHVLLSLSGANPDTPRCKTVKIVVSLFRGLRVTQFTPA